MDTWSSPLGGNIGAQPKTTQRLSARNVSPSHAPTTTKLPEVFNHREQNDASFVPPATRRTFYRASGDSSQSPPERRVPFEQSPRSSEALALLPSPSASSPGLIPFPPQTLSPSSPPNKQAQRRMMRRSQSLFQENSARSPPEMWSPPEIGSPRFNVPSKSQDIIMHDTSPPVRAQKTERAQSLFVNCQGLPKDSVDASNKSIRLELAKLWRENEALKMTVRKLQNKLAARDGSNSHAGKTGKMMINKLQTGIIEIMLEKLSVSLIQHVAKHAADFFRHWSTLSQGELRKTGVDPHIWLQVLPRLKGVRSNIVMVAMRHNFDTWKQRLCERRRMRVNPYVEVI